MAWFAMRRPAHDYRDGFIAFLPIRWTQKNGDERVIPAHRLGP
ncbi:MAG: hypothetical protein AMXMBFR4_34700 [Candidatus Hydrogenedentota bacterium]